MHDALHHETKSQANPYAALARFKRAPFSEGDDPNKKSITLFSGNNEDNGGDGTTDGDGEMGDNGLDNNADADLNNTDFERTVVFKVLPKSQTGYRMKPMPGMKDPTIFVRAPDQYSKAASLTRGYVRESQLTSIDKITNAIDLSENRIKGLKLRAVD